MPIAAWLALTVAILGGLAAVVWFVAMPAFFAGTASTGSSSADSMLIEPKALGRIEPAGEVIDVGAMAGDRLIKLAVKEGDVVKEGQPLAYLDSHALRKLEVEAIAYELEQAKSRLAAEQTLAEARIAAARLRLSEARTRQLGLDAQELRIPVLQHNWEVTKRVRSG
jgi:HlyD family secretion protein